MHQSLIDRVIELGEGFAHRVGEKQIWPRVEPNLTGEFLATIRSVWIEEGTVKIGCETPEGTFFETWLSFHRLLPKKQGG
jgi:hypothetical protein